MRVAASSPPAASEVHVLARARRGDPGAIRELFERHRDHVASVATSIVRDPMDAEEVVQDVFVTAFAKLEQFRGDAAFSTWLHRIAANTALMRRRRDRSARQVAWEEAAVCGRLREALESARQGSGPWLDDPALRIEAREMIRAAISRLDDKHRAVFELRELQGLSTAAAATALGLGVPAVKTRLHRARRFLRQELGAYFERQRPRRAAGEPRPDLLERPGACGAAPPGVSLTTTA